VNRRTVNVTYLLLVTLAATMLTAGLSACSKTTDATTGEPIDLGTAEVRQ